MTTMSMLIAAISLFVSILSLGYARKAYQNNRQTSIANYLDKYGEELFEIQRLTNHAIVGLKSEAHIACQNVEKLFDKFSSSSYRGRPARHILYDLFNEIFGDFIPNITNDSHSVWHKLQIVLNLRNDDYCHDVKCFRPSSRAKDYYVLLLSMIPQIKYDSLIKEAVEASRHYNEIHKEFTPLLEKSITKFEDSIKKNEYESFKIHESETGQKLLAEKNKFSNLKDIGLEDIFDFIQTDRIKPENWEIRESIYIYSILCIMDQYDKWNGAPKNLKV